MNTLPLVRIEIDQMRHAIIHAMTRHFDDQKSSIEAQLEQIVKEFDFGAVIKAEADKALREQIAASVKNAVYRAFTREELTKPLEDLAVSHLKGMLENLTR